MIIHRGWRRGEGGEFWMSSSLYLLTMIERSIRVALKWDIDLENDRTPPHAPAPDALRQPNRLSGHGTMNIAQRGARTHDPEIKSLVFRE
ncbi:hypothetical protein AVEN_65355-1 [Araneus ventricosus]|uniref:Uncharacterized protein n=1 Tax=Araneus ventricosus TaxID=182803 RepID=A0A4Y2H4K0_ARAVE|nr:hypothetical protein AVEN_65355-1 [Araneus ventricosus]